MLSTDKMNKKRKLQIYVKIYHQNSLPWFMVDINRRRKRKPHVSQPSTGFGKVFKL